MSNPIPFDEALFRAQFPAFADETKYPLTVLSMWWDEIGCWIEDGGPGGFLQGQCTVAAMNMLLAHFLELSAKNKANGKSKQGGYKTSSTIDKVSVSYLAPPNQSQYDWWLNQTNYGAMLAAFLEMKAVGGFHVGGLPERNGFRKFGGTFR